MSNNRLIVRLLAPLAVALFIVAITIGLSAPTLVETVDGNVVCASAFGNAGGSGATEAGQASCAALTSERQMWSFTLLGTSLGLLVGVFWVALSTSRRTEDDLPAAPRPADSGPADSGPADSGPSGQWVDYPAAGLGEAPSSAAPQQQPAPQQSPTPLD